MGCACAGTGSPPLSEIRMIAGLQFKGSWKGLLVKQLVCILHVSVPADSTQHCKYKCQGTQQFLSCYIQPNFVETWIILIRLGWILNTYPDLKQTCKPSEIPLVINLASLSIEKSMWMQEWGGVHVCVCYVEG